MRAGHALLGAALALALVAPTGAAAQRRVNRRVAVDPRVSVRLHNLVGSTKVMAWDKDSVALVGTVPAAADFFFGGGGAGVKGGVELPEGADTLAAQLELWVPHGARVWVKSASADIEVTGQVRSLELFSVSGKVTVHDTSDELTAESMDGAVTVAAGRWSRVKTASGRIDVRGGDDVGITTVTGPVHYVGSDFRRTRLESVSGDLWFEGAPPRSARLELESHSGRISLELPPTVAAEFSITVFGGAVRNDFGAQSPRPAGEIRSRTLEFTAGTGGADVVVRSFKGDVEVRSAGK